MLFQIRPSILHLLKINVSMFDSEVNMTFTHNFTVLKEDVNKETKQDIKL